jgi:hypothetical protein
VTECSKSSPGRSKSDTSQDDGGKYNDIPGLPAPNARHFAVIHGNGRDTLDARASLTAVGIDGDFDDDRMCDALAGRRDRVDRVKHFA